MVRILIVLFVVYSCAIGAKLPANFQICRHGTPEHLNKCLKTAIQDALPKMKDGIPELKIPPVDPLSTPEATIGEGTGPVHIVQHYKDFKLFGISKTIIDDASISFTPTTFELLLKAHAPEYRIEADYVMDGRLLLFPVQGEGKCTITLTNITVDINIAGDIFQKKGKEFLKVKMAKPTPTPEIVKFNYENLFNGNKELAKQIDGVFNENWKEIFYDIRPAFIELLDAIFTNYINVLFSQVSSNDLFPH